ncbi:hypothetical protein [Halalkalibacter krulwichiae]|uniref:Uncharacterized protein n=1 Tax=Halalkalibacter krulwichiae TaxID=199441 RepID=A0A1X9MKH6_9BACI|nr:hypothetical protein [Halalkalibacter krulwichiae]ARK32161.1 hypothetical protein BkAM31D_21210 [Halalkalibacter krulwichiae]
MSKKIETLEQRNKALEWMVKMAEHPLDPVNKDEKTKRIYELTSAQVQAFNEKLYKGSEFPSEIPPEEKKPEPIAEKQPEKPNQDLSGWLD